MADAGRLVDLFKERNWLQILLFFTAVAALTIFTTEVSAWWKRWRGLETQEQQRQRGRWYNPWRRQAKPRSGRQVFWRAKPPHHRQGACTWQTPRWLDAATPWPLATPNEPKVKISAW